jgi:hypothetical protein
MLLPQQRTTNALLARETGAESPVDSAGAVRDGERGGALRYLLPHVPFPSQIDNFSQGRFALTGDVWGAGIPIGQSD